jgi:hypothetical protein
MTGMTTTQGVPTAANLPGVPKPRMVIKNFRVPAALWEQAKAAAEEREESLSDVIREALQRYVNRKS